MIVALLSFVSIFVGTFLGLKAAEFDEYWQEKSRAAYYNEVNYLRQCQVEELEARDV